MANEDDPRAMKADHEFLHDGMVTVIFGEGESQKKFHVHNGLLRQRSSCARDSSKNMISCTLSGHTPESFELYQEYIYTGRIPCKQLLAHGGFDYDYQNNGLVDFYSVASRMGDPTAAHAALAAFLASFRELKDRGMVAAPASNLMEKVRLLQTRNSPIYRLFIDMLVWDAGEDMDLDSMPKEVAVDVAYAALKQIREGKAGNEAWKTATCCDYHELSDGKKCQTRKRKRDEA